MLVVTRRINEKVVISFCGTEVIVELRAVRGDQVKLGFEAPLDVKIDRMEIYKKKRGVL